MNTFFSKKNVFRSASLARRSVSLARRSDRSSCSYCSNFVRDASRSFASRANAFPGSTSSVSNESRSELLPKSFFASAATRDARTSAANDFVRYVSAAFSATCIRALYVFAIKRAARASSCTRRSAGSRSSAEGSDPPNRRESSFALVSVASFCAREVKRVCSFPETPLREGGREEAYTFAVRVTDSANETVKSFGGLGVSGASSFSSDAASSGDSASHTRTSTIEGISPRSSGFGDGVGRDAAEGQMRNHEMFPAGSAADAARRSEGDVSGAVAARARTSRSTRCTTRAAICERRFVVLSGGTPKKETLVSGTDPTFLLSFRGLGVGGGFSKANGPMSIADASRTSHGDARATRCRDRGEARRGRSRRLCGGVAIPPDPFQASRSRPEEKRASAGASASARASSRPRATA